MKHLSPDEIKEIEVPKPLNETQRILKEALMRLEDGKRWGKHFREERGRYCALGAVGVAMTGDSDAFIDHEAPTMILVDAAKTLGASSKNTEFDESWFVANLNNNAKDFSEVRTMFEKAIELAA